MPASTGDALCTIRSERDGVAWRTSSLKATRLSLSSASETNFPTIPTVKTSLLLAGLVAFSVETLAEIRDPLLLWPEGAPGALGKEEKDIPTVTPYLPDPDKATDSA